MYEEKKQPKKMINGWRSDHVDRLQRVIDREVDAHGTAFTKAVLMDHLLRLGLDSFEEQQGLMVKRGSRGSAKIPVEMKHEKTAGASCKEQ